jgi:hypothetical protein
MENNNNIIQGYDFIKPSHYNRYDMEVVDMIDKIWGHEDCAKWCKITAFKYRMRMGMKPGEDIQRELDKENVYLELAEKYHNMYLNSLTKENTQN